MYRNALAVSELFHSRQQRFGELVLMYAFTDSDVEVMLYKAVESASVASSLRAFHYLFGDMNI